MGFTLICSISFVSYSKIRHCVEYPPRFISWKTDLIDESVTYPYLKVTLMFDFSAAREHMIDCQIRTSDVTDYAILKAFRAVPREKFVPKASTPLSYSDTSIQTEDGRVMMKPRDISKLIQAAEIQSTDIVLDIACGRGYSSAILAQLAETVVALEDTDEAVERASSNLSAVEANNAVVVKGDLKAGAKEHGPFDVIFVNGSVQDLPKTWFEQLANNGRLVAVVEDQGVGRATLFTKSGDTVGDRIVFDANVPMLAGTEKKPAFSF